MKIFVINNLVKYYIYLFGLFEPLLWLLECFEPGIPDWWFGVGGNGLSLPGWLLLVTMTVAGCGIAVPPPLPAFAYGTGICLELKQNKNML